MIHKTTTTHTSHAQDFRAGERGSALLLALAIIVILTLLGFGLLTRTALVSQMAGGERWATQAFFAADAGIEVAKERVKTNRQPFNFQVQDLRGASGRSQAGLIDVEVSAFDGFGVPAALPGYEIGGGQGGSSTIIVSASYRGTAVSQARRTRSEARIDAILNYSPFVVTPDTPF